MHLVVVDLFLLYVTVSYYLPDLFLCEVEMVKQHIEVDVTLIIHCTLWRVMT